jgi:EAL domain-containing protein (putative c-di-GMP-specific phosphodiesterase class I)
MNSPQRKHASQPLGLQNPEGQRFVVGHTPFKIGRHPENDLTLHNPDVSGHHAELRFDGMRWMIRDLQSSNGTFINGDPVRFPTAVKAGDRIQLGRTILRVNWASSILPKVPQTRDLSGGQGGVMAAIELARVIGDRKVAPYFQPIVDMRRNQLIGWEALARPQAPKIAGPAALLELAASYDSAAALCEAFSVAASECVTCGRCWPQKPRMLFVNFHPERIVSRPLEMLLTEPSIQQLRQWAKLVIEIPEELACEAAELQSWVDTIRGHDALVAYDDFGKGQSRLTELLSVPPDIIKLDRALITQLDQQRTKARLVEAVVEASVSLGVKTLAEGIETEQERQACQSLGIDFGQGYLLARPAPAYELFRVDPVSLPDTCPFVRLSLSKAQP